MTVLDLVAILAVLLSIGFLAWKIFRAWRGISSGTPVKCASCGTCPYADGCDSNTGDVRKNQEALSGASHD